MPSGLSWTLRVAFGALLTLALPLTAQQDPVPGESFGEAIDISVVNLDVFVTSKKGKPVEGLTAEDFEVFEDGKPVKISNFYAEKGIGAAPAEAGTPAERPADQRLRLVVFVDDVNMEPAGRARILGRSPRLSARTEGATSARETSPGSRVELETRSPR